MQGGQAWAWLTPRSLSDYARVAIGATGPHLTPDDVKHALGGLGEKPYRFAMAAFLGDARSWRISEGYLVQELRWLAEAGEWLQQRADAARLERMAGLLIFQVMTARSQHDTYAHERSLPTGAVSTRCPRCNGLGWYSNRHELRRARRRARVYRRAIECGRWENLQQLRALREGLAEEKHAERAALCTVCGPCHGTGVFLLTEARRARIIGVSRATWYRDWQARMLEAIEVPMRWEEIAIRHVQRRLRDRR